jgi:hypothetical protein
MDQINFANNSKGKQWEALLCCLTSGKISFREKISFQPRCNVSEFGLWTHKRRVSGWVRQQQRWGYQTVHREREFGAV